jgi:anti-sigma factor RsiW
MRCRHVIDLLGDLVSNELPPAQRDQVNEHVHTCPNCAALEQSYRQVIALAQRLPPVPLPAGMLQRFQQRLKALSQEQPVTGGC